MVNACFRQEIAQGTSRMADRGRSARVLRTVASATLSIFPSYVNMNFGSPSYRTRNLVNAMPARNPSTGSSVQEP